MIIKVLGIGRPNRGAELMLAAIEDKVEKIWPGSTVVTSNASDIFVKTVFLLNRKIGFPLFPYKICDIPSLIPKALRQILRLKADIDVNIFLDASGFAYGDQWGVSKLRQRITYSLPEIKRRKGIFIVLPQALGPFTKDSFQKELILMTDNADFIFVRDRISLDYLQARVGVRSNIAISSDFTNLIIPTTYKEKMPGNLAIIPNTKMLEMKAVADSSTYIAVLLKAISTARLLGYEPFLLNHEGQKDNSLIEQINQQLDVKLPVFCSNDPLRIKSVIGKCRIVVSSRFHGLVSALSQDVPVLAMGWSHKYKELMSDYDCSEYLTEVDSDAVVTALTKIDNRYLEIKTLISKNSKILKRQVSEMWEDVELIVKRSRLS